MNSKFLLPLAIVALMVSSCKKSPEGQTSSGNTEIPDDFTYSTADGISVDLTVRDINDAPVQGVRIDLHTPDGKERLATGATDATGAMKTMIRVPSYLKEVLVRVRYINIENEKVIEIRDNAIAADFGGNPGSRGKKGKTSGTQTITPAGTNWFYMGSYDSDGVPNYLENPGDVFDSKLLTDINSTLPEFLDIPVNKPQLLTPTNAFDIHLTATGKVWITFVSEGAGAKNSLGYFVYDTNNPPTSEGDIDSIMVLMPNTSRLGSGGGLLPGDKVYLGEFNAGQSIGWVLMANGWDPINQEIKAANPSQTKFYSTYSFNPEGSAALRQHNVQLLDAGRGIVFVGYEDIRRDYSSDNDFNDLIFYTTVTPFSSLDTSNIPPADYCNLDDDNDGILNCDEDYRDDPNRAYNNTYTGSLGFEDLWPSQGDYDFNDLVMDYSTNMVTNASNDVVDINTTYTMRALGGYINHGFGVQYDKLTPAQVSTLTGSQITQSLATLSGNGTESGQTQAVAIVYDRHSDNMSNPGTAFINTEKNQPTTATVDIDINMTLTNPLSVANVGLPPYNPFLFTEDNRGKEIHLPNKKPTDKVNSSFFGQGDDNSVPASGRYYKTTDNKPWAIHIAGDYSYPVEYAPIYNAYLNFNNWATSNGVNFADWYVDQAGYRDNNLIY